MLRRSSHTALLDWWLDFCTPMELLTSRKRRGLPVLHDLLNVCFVLDWIESRIANQTPAVCFHRAFDMTLDLKEGN
jgi:hypothetical protein